MMVGQRILLNLGNTRITVSISIRWVAHFLLKLYRLPQQAKRSYVVVP